MERRINIYPSTKNALYGFYRVYMYRQLYFLQIKFPGQNIFVFISFKVVAFYKPHLFVFDETTELCYLMPSVQDDNLLMWVLAHNKRLTILLEHFTEFHNSLLEKLSLYYTVMFTDPKSKKTAPYSFEMISNEINK